MLNTQGRWSEEKRNGRMRGVRDYWVIYYLVYVVSVMVLTILNWGSFVAESYVYLLAAIGGASITIALFVAIVTEGIGFMVLLIPRRVKKLKDEGRQEGREEGREETHREWMAWYRRQQVALRDGLPFNEPPPDAPTDKRGK